MENRGNSWVVNFIVRSIIGVAVIFCVNQLLDYRNVPVSVGVNPITFLTSGMLGIPGVAMLYGIVFYRVL